MSGIEFCGDAKPHLPHEWKPETGYTYGVNICAGELVPGASPVRGTLHFVLAAVMETKNQVNASYEDDTIASTAAYKIEQAFENLAANIRTALETS